MRRWTSVERSSCQSQSFGDLRLLLVLVTTTVDFRFLTKMVQIWTLPVSLLNPSKKVRPDGNENHFPSPYDRKKHKNLIDRRPSPFLVLFKIYSHVDPFCLVGLRTEGNFYLTSDVTHDLLFHLPCWSTPVRPTYLSLPEVPVQPFLIL